MRIKLDPTPCPTCGQPHTCASDPLDMDLKPVEGDVSICRYCEEAHIFNADLSLRFPKDGELDGYEEAIEKFRAMNKHTRVKGGDLIDVSH